MLDCKCGGEGAAVRRPSCAAPYPYPLFLQILYSNQVICRFLVTKKLRSLAVSPGDGRCYEMIVRFRARPSYSNCAPGEGNYLQCK
jgi:hypothetical protein